MRRTIPGLAFFLVCVLYSSTAVTQIIEWEVGLTSNRALIRARGVSAAVQAAPTILYLAGLTGNTGFSDELESILENYARTEERSRPVKLIIIPVANPDGEELIFPPLGRAYAENPVSHALWRWIGTHAPDLVIVAGQDAGGFVDALQGEAVASFGSIPVQVFSTRTTGLNFLLALQQAEASEASLELARRLVRTPAELADQLAQSYGYNFSTPAYVPGMSLIGRMRLGQMQEIEIQLQPYLTGSTIEVNNASVMAGQLVFAEFAERTGNAAARQLTINAAELAFDEQGNPRAAMPMHAEMSDSFFMVTPLLVKAGKLTAESKYFDMAARHVNYMREMLVQENGLYRHSPEADVAWSRGNGFPALGMALSLSDFPETHPAYGALMSIFIHHLESLLPYQDVDGMWHEVIDYPGSFAEITSTAMIGIAIKRGLDRNWLPAATYQPVLDKIWRAVSIRTSLGGEFINACTSTGKMPSLDAYLDRPAILGRDDRAGGVVMLFANEMAGNR